MTVPLPSPKVDHFDGTLDGPGVQRNFERLAQLFPDTGGKSIRVRFGIATLAAGGSTAARSQTLTVSHGLATTPVVVLATDQFGAWTSVNAANYTATTFDLSASTVDGSNFPATVNAAWVAIG